MTLEQCGCVEVMSSCHSVTKTLLECFLPCAVLLNSIPKSIPIKQMCLGKGQRNVTSHNISCEPSVRPPAKSVVLSQCARYMAQTVGSVKQLVESCFGWVAETLIMISLIVFLCSQRTP